MFSTSMIKNRSTRKNYYQSFFEKQSKIVNLNKYLIMENLKINQNIWKFGNQVVYFPYQAYPVQLKYM